jgi:uncharacterized protein (DUF1015 family)
MASLFPFRALRPEPAVAADVASVPYDVVNTDEARELATGHPLSFLHASRAEIDLAPDTDPHADEVYTRARENFDRLRREAPLVSEGTPSLYFYRLRMGDHVQTGLAGCYSVDDYDRHVILKHEKTRKDKEDDRTRHMLELRAQTGPVFLTYPASPAVDAVAATVTAGAPLFDFTAPDGVRHTLWRVGDGDTASLVRAFAAMPHLYIADGHHRAASAARARAELRARGEGPGDADRFLAVAFPDDQVQILAYNRIVKDLAGRRPGELIEALRATHAVEPGPAVPARKGEVSMFLAGHWYTVVLKQGTSPASPGEALDCSLLQQQVLTPLLGIGDVRTDPRIDFVGGARGTGALEHAVGSGRAAVAFSMFPVGVAELMAISDAGEIMPPKSTWFEPKLRDGLLIHEI